MSQPAGEAHPERREKFIANHLICIFMICFLYVPLLYYIEYYVGLYKYLLALIACHPLLLFPLYKRGKWKLLTNCYATAGFASFLVIACTSGGVTSPHLAWFLAIQVGAYWFHGKNEGRIWSAVTIMAISGIFLYSFFVGPLDYAYPEKHRPF